MKKLVILLLLCSMSQTFTMLQESSKSPKVFLRNEYKTDLLYAELPIVMLLGSKTVKIKPNVLQTEMKLLLKNTQVELNNTFLGLCIATHHGVKSAYYDPQSNTYQSGILDISNTIQKFQKNQPDLLYHNAIITIQSSINPFYLLSWKLSTTWERQLKSVRKVANSKKRFVSTISADAALIDIDTDQSALLMRVSETIDIGNTKRFI